MSTVKRIALPAFFTVTLAFALFAPARAEACSCMAPPPPAESRDAAAAVFEGRVVAVPAPGQPTDNLQVRLRVVRAWKGVTTEEVTVTTASNSAACGFTFEADHSYLVYAHANEDGTLGVSLCSRTAPIENASEDITVLGAGVTTVNPTPNPGEEVPAPPQGSTDRTPPAAAGCQSCTVAPSAVAVPGSVSTLALLALVALRWGSSSRRLRRTRSAP